MIKPESTSTRTIDKLVEDFCDIILVKEDYLDYTKGIRYIKNLNNKERKLLCGFIEFPDAIRRMRKAVLPCVTEYISQYFTKPAKVIGNPFNFDQGHICVYFQQRLQREYNLLYPEESYPKLLSLIIDYIMELSEQYSIFESFYKVRIRETSEQILTDMQELAHEETLKVIGDTLDTAVDSATDKAVERATTLARNNAKRAAEAAKEAADKAEQAAKEEADSAVTAKMNDLMSKVSESNVTILGIFAGIVLTIVAGLFYSSSVLESINNANMYKLIFASVVVGFVCINLLAVMFNYIDKFRHGVINKPKQADSNKDNDSEKDDTPDKENDLSQDIQTEYETLKKDKCAFFLWCKQVLYPKIMQHLFVVILDAILIGMIIFFGCKAADSDEKQIINQNQYDANISVDVNMPEQNNIVPTTIPTEEIKNTISVTPIPTEPILEEDNEEPEEVLKNQDAI